MSCSSPVFFKKVVESQPSDSLTRFDVPESRRPVTGGGGVGARRSPGTGGRAGCEPDPQTNCLAPSPQSLTCHVR